jgi:hypothetical protein
LIAGLALVAVTNGVALGGAAWNRSGTPDSVLALTQRELEPPYMFKGSQENSGLTLQLLWRVVPVRDHDERAFPYSTGSGAPAWLDAAKMQSLGFETKSAVDDASARGFERYRSQLPRDVFVVLELDGPAYQEILERTRQAATVIEAKDERGEGKKTAQALIDGETNRSSRLFAVDVGLDRDALRRQFADRARYAIVRGQVRPAWAGPRVPASGLVSSLSADNINVPLEMRGVFEGVVRASYRRPSDDATRFEARLAFGQRLEPWLVSATRK